MKLPIFTIAILLCFHKSIFSQTKKEQLIQITYDFDLLRKNFDSLNHVLQNTAVTNKKEKDSLSSAFQSLVSVKQHLENELEKVKSENVSLKTRIDSLRFIIDALKINLDLVQKNLQIKSDSLNSLRPLNLKGVTYTNLSNTYNFNISLEKKKNPNEESSIDSIVNRIIITIIYKKNDKLNQIINVELIDERLYEDAFRDKNNSRSYITGFNKSKIAQDGDYGDIVVADINFDGEEDLIIKRNEGGNMGPFYIFFTKQKDDLFYEDKFLSENVKGFPSKINPENRTITIYGLRMSGYNETIFKYDLQKSKWLLEKGVYNKYKKGELIMETSEN